MQPEGAKVMEGMFIPWCEDCGSRELMQAVGIVGAVIMPHNLYLHSGLVKVSNYPNFTTIGSTYRVGSALVAQW